MTDLAITELQAVTRATQDNVLLNRFVAAAIRAEMPYPEQWVMEHRYELIMASIEQGNQDGETLLSAYHYFDNARETALRAVPALPGDVDGVGDVQIIAAVANVLVALQGPQEDAPEEGPPIEEAPLVAQTPEDQNEV